MIKGIHNYSEIGKLRKVLLHRIGSEVDGLVPDNFERLLFDDIPYLKVAQQEHDRFAEMLRENGAEVVYYTDEAAKALADPEVKDRFVDEMLAELSFTSLYVREAVTDYLKKMEPKALVEKVIAGVRKHDIEDYKPKTLAEKIDAAYPFFTDPMPNMYFTRDQAACVGNGVTIHHMSTATRRRESLLMKYMYEYNKDFAPEGTEVWYTYDGPFSIEGGDILVLSDKIAALSNFRIKGLRLPQRTQILVAEFGWMAVMPHMVFILRRPLNVHVSGIPVPEHGHALRSPVAPDAELRVAEPFGHFIGAQGFKTGFKARIHTYLSILFLLVPRLQAGNI